ncbi:GNAT family N-acetyltransferase [bacterium]|nr:GNAT family N-acetyltransferase [bacterium]
MSFLSNMNRINFTATHIKDVPVLKRDKDTYKNEKVALVELDKNDSSDLKALYKASVNWNLNGATHISSIFFDATKDNNYPNVEKEHYLAITKQKNKFDNLRAEDIIGVALFSELDSCDNELSYLEVRPDLKTQRNGQREYKKIGTAMLDFLKETYNQKDIFVNSVPSAIDFYKKNNFESLSDNFQSQMYYFV